MASHSQARRPQGMTPLCRLDELSDPGARSFMVGADNIIVVRKDGKIFAYANWCPHLGTPLEIMPGRLLTRDKSHLFCSTHGAQFRIADGFCVDGPCEGESLKAIDVREEGGLIYRV